LAQEWPSRPVKFIVSQAPGTSPDITARYLADRLSKLWNQSVVVENRPAARTCRRPGRGALGARRLQLLLRDHRRHRIQSVTFKTLPLRSGEGLRPGGDDRQVAQW
jgi:hypothetical protein